MKTVVGLILLLLLFHFLYRRSIITINLPVNLPPQASQVFGDLIYDTDLKVGSLSQQIAGYLNQGFGPEASTSSRPLEGIDGLFRRKVQELKNSFIESLLAKLGFAVKRNEASSSGSILPAP